MNREGECAKHEKLRDLYRECDTNRSYVIQDLVEEETKSLLPVDLAIEKSLRLHVTADNILDLEKECDSEEVSGIFLF